MNLSPNMVPFSQSTVASSIRTGQDWSRRNSDRRRVADQHLDKRGRLTAGSEKFEDCRLSFDVLRSKKKTGMQTKRGAHDVLPAPPRGVSPMLDPIWNATGNHIILRLRRHGHRGSYGPPTFFAVQLNPLQIVQLTGHDGKPVVSFGNNPFSFLELPL